MFLGSRGWMNEWILWRNITFLFMGRNSGSSEWTCQFLRVNSRMLEVCWCDHFLQGCSKCRVLFFSSGTGFLPHKFFYPKPWESYEKWHQLFCVLFRLHVAHLSLCPFEVTYRQLSRWIMTLSQTHGEPKFVTNRQIFWTQDEPPRVTIV